MPIKARSTSSRSILKSPTESMSERVKSAFLCSSDGTPDGESGTPDGEWYPGRSNVVPRTVNGTPDGKNGTPDGEFLDVNRPRSPLS